jgi:hypothetical protein
MLPVFLRAQNDSLLQPQKKYEVEAVNFTADALGNLYLLTANDQIKKINERGDSLGLFNLTKRFGRLTHIDATNPLKVLLLYGDFATIQVIDRFMNVVNTLDLRRQKITQVKVVAPSYDNEIWFYDEQEARLGKINDQGIVTRQTVDLRQVLGEAPTPEKIIDNDGLVYLYDAQKGLFVFDYYGAFKKHLSILGWSSFHAFNQVLFGLKDGHLEKQPLNSPIGSNFLLPESTAILRMVAGFNRLYLHYPTHIDLFRVP